MKLAICMLILFGAGCIAFLRAEILQQPDDIIFKITFHWPVQDAVPLFVQFEQHAVDAAVVFAGDGFKKGQGVVGEGRLAGGGVERPTAGGPRRPRGR